MHDPSFDDQNKLERVMNRKKTVFDLKTLRAFLNETHSGLNGQTCTCRVIELNLDGHCCAIPSNCTYSRTNSNQTKSNPKVRLNHIKNTTGSHRLLRTTNGQDDGRINNGRNIKISKHKNHGKQQNIEIEKSAKWRQNRAL